MKNAIAQLGSRNYSKSFGVNVPGHGIENCFLYLMRYRELGSSFYYIFCKIADLFAFLGSRFVLNYGRPYFIDNHHYLHGSRKGKLTRFLSPVFANLNVLNVYKVGHKETYNNICWNKIIKIGSAYKLRNFSLKVYPIGILPTLYRPFRFR